MVSYVLFFWFAPTSRVQGRVHWLPAACPCWPLATPWLRFRPRQAGHASPGVVANVIKLAWTEVPLQREGLMTYRAWLLQAWCLCEADSTLTALITKMLPLVQAKMPWLWEAFLALRAWLLQSWCLRVRKAGLAPAFVVVHIFPLIYCEMPFLWEDAMALGAGLLRLC